MSETASVSAGSAEALIEANAACVAAAESERPKPPPGIGGGRHTQSKGKRKISPVWSTSVVS
jgi:hypothetical protein